MSDQENKEPDFRDIDLEGSDIEDLVHKDIKVVGICRLPPQAPADDSQHGIFQRERSKELP